MAQAIRNIRAGQKFEIVDMSISGFDIGCIVEAIDDVDNVDNNRGACGSFKWVGGYKPTLYPYRDVTLVQHKSDLKRFRGKIK